VPDSPGRWLSGDPVDVLEPQPIDNFSQTMRDKFEFITRDDLTVEEAKALYLPPLDDTSDPENPVLIGRKLRFGQTATMGAGRVGTARRRDPDHLVVERHA
jgi:hypothetical protein